MSYPVFKGLVDWLIALFLLTVSLPVFLLVSLLVYLSSPGPIIFSQKRVGLYGNTFYIYKFRSLKSNGLSAGSFGQLESDRTTRIGNFLRKSRLDELPQLINIIKGEMSFVGPRPELPGYITYYGDDCRSIFSVKPGVTDYCSLSFSDETSTLAEQVDPEGYYLTVLIPRKVLLINQYVQNQSFLIDMHILILTIFRFFTLAL